MNRLAFVLSMVAVAAAQAAVAEEKPRSGFQYDDRVAVSLSAPGRVKLGEPIPIQFTLTNRTDRPINVLRTGTPFWPLVSDMFIVMLDGVEVPYRGVVAYMRSGQETPAAWLHLPPHGSASVTVDVGSRSAYPVVKNGVLSVAPRRNILVDVVAGPPAALIGRTARTQSRVDISAVEIVVK